MMCPKNVRELLENGVEAFLYCQLEGAVGEETVTLARQQSTDIFILVRWTLFRIKLCE